MAACSNSDESLEFDLLITNASIIDGSGTAAYPGSVLIRDGMIAEIGDVDTTGMRIKEVLDAGGRVAAPGFIDPHSHGNPLETPEFSNFLSMGVTTISLGQDGSSPGMNDLTGWMNRVDSVGTGPNIVHFTGHNSLRRHVNVPRRPGPEEFYINEMKTILESALQSGSFGLTTGLEYDHGSFSDLTELIELARPVAEANGLVMSHMRNEDDDQVANSVAELINQGLGSGARVHASHLKMVFGEDPGQAEDILSMMRDARENEGLPVTADLYPYTASYTGIAILFPDWALPPNDFNEVVQNRRPELEEYLRNRVNRRNGPEATLFGTDPWAGMTLAEAARQLNKPFEDFLIDDIGPNGASAAYFVMNESVMNRFLEDPHVMISSDGSPTMHHPRGYGSFAKVIRKYVIEDKLLSLEGAVHKMSGLPAETLGLSDPEIVEVPRGYIREGFAADLLLFDPENVRDHATFENPHAYAGGFDWVLVNGAVMVRNGTIQDRRPSGVIRKKITP